MFRTVLTLILIACTPRVLAVDLEEILDRNAEEVGAAAMAQVQSIKVELQITEPTFEVTGTYLATRDGFMRIDIYAGEDRVFAEGLTSECAWAWNPGQAEEDLGVCVGETETAALRHGIEMPGNFFTLRDVRERGATVELIGEVATGAKAEWHIRVTLTDGFARDYFIDQTSFRITRARDFRAFHPGIDSTKVNIETRYEDPQTVKGVLRFQRQVNVNIDTGEVLGTTQILSVEQNPELEIGMFEARWLPD